jgi:threonine dehydratase
LQLNKEQKQRGVATHSSGNHAQALALAAQKQGIKAYIVMPQNSPEIKKKGVKEYGGIIIKCKNTLQAREQVLEQVLSETNAVFIPPYNHLHIIAGQATAAKELLEEISELDAVISPLGGGGLASGTCLSAHYFSPQTQVYGAEPQLANDAYLSLQKGTLIPAENSTTIADGLKTSLGEITFAILQKHINQIICVEENEIKQALRLIMERMKIVVEPSSAVTLAAVLKNKSLFKNKKIGLILSGGNIDLNKLPLLLAEEL